MNADQQTLHRKQLLYNKLLQQVKEKARLPFLTNGRNL